MYEMQNYFECNPLVDIRSNFCVLLYTLHSYEIDVTKVTNEQVTFLSTVSAFKYQACCWEKVLLRFSSRFDSSVPFVFLIYINYLSDGIESVHEVFAEKTCIFSTINEYLGTTRQWAHQ